MNRAEVGNCCTDGFSSWKQASIFGQGYGLGSILSGTTESPDGLLFIFIESQFRYHYICHFKVPNSVRLFVYCRDCAIITTIQIQNIFIIIKKNLYPLTVTLHFLHPSMSSLLVFATTNVPSVSMDLPFWMFYVNKA